MAPTSQRQAQTRLLTDGIEPVLRQRHPDNDYAIGMNAALYWRSTAPTERGCQVVDWFYAPGVSRAPGGVERDSYFLWQEGIAPLVTIAFVSGNGLEERDSTPWSGKFWTFEQGIRIPYYAIYEVNPGRIELFRLTGGEYESVQANQRGNYPIPLLGVELGIWHGFYMKFYLPWVRWWDLQGNLLPTTGETEAALQTMNQSKA